MGSQVELTNRKNQVLSGKSSPVSPFSFPNIPTTYSSGSSPADPTQNLKFSDGLSYHQRCSSESFLPEEQPSWLDELLNDSDTAIFHRGHHRRSASDTYAYLGDVTDTLATSEGSNYGELCFGPNSQSQMNFVDVESIAIGKALSLDKKIDEVRGPDTLKQIKLLTGRLLTIWLSMICRSWKKGIREGRKLIPMRALLINLVVLKLSLQHLRQKPNARSSMILFIPLPYVLFSNKDPTVSISDRTEVP